MKHFGRLAIVAVLAIAVLALSSCAEWLGPSIDGSWTAFGDYLVDFGGSAGEIGGLTALFESGAYRFEYTMTEPYPDGPSTATWHEGSLDPGEPGEGDAFTMTVTASSDNDYSPPVGESFEGTVVYLGRDVLVLDIDAGQIQTWSFRRQ
ncbi:MAG: hypothetical protein ACOC6J_03760 [Spirochaetota bacterium]